MAAPTVVTVLKRALAKIQKGWVQDVSRKRVKGQVCYCASGAITHSVATYSDVVAEACNCLRDAIHQREGVRLHIVDFNDAPGRRKSAVVSVFKAAIRLAERDVA